MPRLAIIIPVVGNIPALEATLVSVLANRPNDCEIVVVLNKPYDDPYDLADEVHFVHAPARAKLTACCNAGLAASTAPIVHLLAAGCEVTEGWADLAAEHFRAPRVGAVAPLVVHQTDHRLILSAGLEYAVGGARKWLRPKPSEAAAGPKPVLGPTLTAAFYRRAALEVIGGLDVAVGTLADVDAALLLRRAGYAAIVEPRSHVLCQPDVVARERGFALGLHAERLFWRNAPQAHPLKLALRHALTVLGQLAGDFPRPALLAQLAGRLLACCQMGNYAKHRTQITRLAASLPSPLGRTHGQHFRLDQPHTSGKPADAYERGAKQV